MKFRSVLFSKWVLWGVVCVMLSVVLFNTYLFFQSVKVEERQKMEIWAKAYETINNANPETTDIEFPSQIIISNQNIPIVLCDEDHNVISIANVENSENLTEVEKQYLIKDFASKNKPLRIIHPVKNQVLYFGNSFLITKMKYYPFVLISILVFFILLVWRYFNVSKVSVENKLWVGMAKETAHQIGTPLSSLLGWIEIMRLTIPDELDMIVEIERDVDRLQTIADRFSKIGSESDLELVNVVKETEKVFDYIVSRSSKKIDFRFESDADIVNIWLNPILHSWTIENLMKNAIDAIGGIGRVIVRIKFLEPFIQIKIIDTGKGIEKGNFTKVFEPGFSTKKRGWGLGLSLTKRIVEFYHKGKVKVLFSEPGVGTTFLIRYKRS